MAVYSREVLYHYLQLNSRRLPYRPRDLVGTWNRLDASEGGKWNALAAYAVLPGKL